MKMLFEGKNFMKMGNGLNIYDCDNKCTPGAGLPPPWGNMHVYYHNIQRSSSLKPNFVWSILRKGELKCI